MGRVKWFDQAEGYGFILPADGGDEIYVSRRAIANTRTKSLNEGQDVEFSICRSSHGLSAADVIAYWPQLFLASAGVAPSLRWRRKPRQYPLSPGDGLTSLDTSTSIPII